MVEEGAEGEEVVTPLMGEILFVFSDIALEEDAVVTCDKGEALLLRVGDSSDR